MDDEKAPVDPTGCTSGLTQNFRQVRGGLSVAELRPAQDDLLDSYALAPLLHVCPRTARTLIARWRLRGQANPALPRVVRVRTKGRPGHRVERESFERWRRRHEPVGSTA